MRFFICAAFDKISTDNASRFLSLIAESLDLLNLLPFYDCRNCNFQCFNNNVTRSEFVILSDAKIILSLSSSSASASASAAFVLLNFCAFAFASVFVFKPQQNCWTRNYR